MRLVLGGIVCVSAFVSLVWMFMVPFFQAPDENGHFDYAYQLLSVGRPYRVAHARSGGMMQVDDAARYLERVSNFDGVRLMSGARVPPDYGSAAFYHRVDRFAPSRARGVPATGSPLPSVMFMYPAGFYTLAAGAMALASSLTHRSLVAEFFFARAIGVICLCVALPLGYRIFRANGATEPIALMGTASIGLFPMTSWVAAYIQPDNLVFALVTLCLVLALRWRQQPDDHSTSIALGCVLATIFFVKQQYAAVAYAVSAALVLSTLLLRGSRLKKRGISLGFICLLPLVAFALSMFATPGGAFYGQQVTPTRLGPPPLGFGQTALETARFIFVSLRDVYISGVAFNRFWVGFGWAENAYFSNAGALALVCHCVGVGSLSIALLFGLRRLDVSRRIVNVGVRRSVRCALALFCRDVVLNMYLLWTALLIFVCAAARGTWWLQGRYWLPVMVPLLAILVRDVPHLVPLKFRTSAATILVSVMLAYALVAAPFALEAAHGRYYGHGRSSARASVIAVEGVGFLGQREPRRHSFVVRRGRSVPIIGVAFAATDGSPIERIAVAIDGGAPVPIRYGVPVSTAIEPMRIGFRGVLSAGKLVPGRHAVTILSYADGKAADRWADELTLDIASRGLSSRSSDGSPGELPRKR